MAKQKINNQPDLAVAPAVEEVIHFARKNSMMEYELVELIIVDGKVTSRKILNKDIPMVIIGKLLRRVRERKVGQ